jgi:hypothetical protein
MVREIPLTQSKVVIVDDEDFAFLSQFKWYAIRQGSRWYAKRTICEGNQRLSTPMHRVILGTPKGFDSDHVNGDGLDNRRCNLRVATRSQNQANSQKRTGTSSKFKGVSWDSTWKRWVARLQVKGKMIRIGRFASEESAAMAYNDTARKYFGPYARPNSTEAL